MKVISREIKIKGITVAIKNQADLNRAIKVTNGLFSKAELGTKEYEKYGRTLGLLKGVNTQINKEVRAFGNSLKATGEIGVSSTDRLKQKMSDLKRVISDLESSKALGLKIDNAKLKEARLELVDIQRVQKDNREEAKKLAKEFVASGKAGAGAYEQLSARLGIVRQRVKDTLAIQAQGGLIDGNQLKKDLQEVGKLDRALKTIDTSVGQSQKFVDEYSRAFGKAGAAIKNLAGGFGVFLGAQAVANVFKKGVENAAAFEKGLDSLSSITGLVDEDLEKLGSRAGEISKLFGTASADILNAFQIVGSKKPELLENADALAEVTKQAEILAKASGLTLPEAADVLTKSLNQYGAGAEEAARFTDILATSQQKGTATIPNLSEALKNVGSVANGIGISFETTNVALQALAKGGLEGAEAGTKLRAVYSRLVKTGRSDLNPATEDLADIMAVLKKEFTNAETGALDLGKAQVVFGERTAGAALTLIQQSDVLNNLSGNLNQLGNAQEQANTNTDNLDGAWKKFLATLNGVARPTFTAIKDALVSVLVGLTAFIGGLKEVPKFVKENKVEILALVTALASFRIASAATSASILFQNASWTAAIGIAKAQVFWTNAVAVANRGLNIVLKANPIGLVVTAISALIVGLAQAYKRSETFRASIDGLANVAKEVFTIVKESVGNFIEGFKQLKEGNFKEGFKQLGEAIKKSNPIGIAFSQGERLGNAFNKGYSGSLDKSTAEKELQDDLKKIKDAGVNSAADAGSSIGESLTQNTIKKLRDEKSKIQSLVKSLTEQRDTQEIDSVKFKSIDKEIKEKQKEIAKLDSEIAKYSTSIKKSNKDVEDSLESLAKDGSAQFFRNQLSELRKELSEGGNDSNFVEEQSKKIVEATNQLESIELSQKLEELRQKFIVGGSKDEGLKKEIEDTAKSLLNLNEATKLLSNTEIRNILEGTGVDIEALIKGLQDEQLKLSSIKALDLRLLNVDKAEAERKLFAQQTIKDSEELEKTLSAISLGAEAERLSAKLQSRTLEVQGRDEAKARLLEIEKEIANTDGLDEIKKKFEGIAQTVNNIEFKDIDGAFDDLADKFKDIDLSVNVNGNTDVSSDLLDQKKAEISALEDLLVTRAANEITDEKERAAKIKEIREQAALELLRIEAESLPKGSNERIALERQIAEQTIAINDEKNQAIIKSDEESAAKRKAIYSQAADAIGNGLNTLLEISDNKASQSAENEKTRLEDDYNRRIELAEGNNDEQQRLKEELAKKQEHIDKREAKRKQGQAVKEATIAGLVAAVKAGPNPLAIAAALLNMGLQIAAIKSVKFAKGGKIRKDGVIEGPSHAGGGVDVFANGKGVEAEGGEQTDFDENDNFFTISKKNTAKYRPVLKYIYGQNFKGKGKILDAIMNDNLSGAVFGGRISDNAPTPSSSRTSTLVTPKDPRSQALIDRIKALPKAMNGIVIPNTSNAVPIPQGPLQMSLNTSNLGPEIAKAVELAMDKMGDKIAEKAGASIGDAAFNGLKDMPDKVASATIKAERERQKLITSQERSQL